VRSACPLKSASRVPRGGRRPSPQALEITARAGCKPLRKPNGCARTELKRGSRIEPVVALGGGSGRLWRLPLATGYTGAFLVRHPPFAYLTCAPACRIS
jgi:hypothetical protein